MRIGARRKSTTSDLPASPNPVQKESGKRKRGRKPQLPMNEAENGANGHDGEENEEYEVDDAHGGEINGDEAPPKLAEGFYEIELIRKTRTHKGIKQYLVKWRGWPESANTWEPAESFASCPDVLEEFESSGKRKRGRKPTVDLSQSKKKQQDSPEPEEPCPGDVTDNNVTANKLNELEGKVDETNSTSFTNQENMTEFAIHIQENAVVEPANRVSKVDETEVCRTSPRIGAKRRKSCAVKQFKTAPKKDVTKNEADDGGVIVQDDVKKADDVVDGLDPENILETLSSVGSVITKIVKPVNYSITMINDKEDVLVSFLVTRSDGEEIVVDNKYLKEHNPVLLIDFYEQHLRYYSPSE